MSLPALLTGLACLCAGLASAQTTKQPDIVFFLIDDLGYADCGFNGGKEIKTPNIDRLAQGGTIIENHYVQPVCSPTRSTLLTGRYPTHTGVYTIVSPGAPWGLPLAERTLADALRSAGYRTALTGKWHLGEFEKAYQPNARGFDHQYGHFFGMLDYFTHERMNKRDWYRNGEPLKEEGYTTHLIAKEACKVIAAGDQAKPLFLYVPFNGVHSPFQVPDSYLKPYAHLKGNRQKLAGMLAAVDEAIGQIEAALKQAGRLENTLIVFSSDNGGPPPGDNTPLRDFKGSIFEGGVRAAAFATWPGRIPAGQRIRQPMHMVDWYPTLIKQAGGSLEQKLPVDGLDVWPMLTKQAASPHDAILSVSTQGPSRAAVRMGDWKLIVDGGAADGAPPGKKKGKKTVGKYEPVALYDLSADPGEAKNLADAQPERVKAMRARLAELLRDAAPSGVR
ncbi:MAG: arylsulfatase [Opitutales bacterium]|jgi:arylsulfatase A-like enzyme|nr:arylsulfatase [Opitutales bacterium]MDP4657999.1 arylsulfatase [Opitutales bacterium]MDP4776177.1 arylsulfatase [Opitutales bacterium]MDP4787638.1 arylsulfatase [Opitutales bacterium]MDP4861003.1 arylsulfatase [Opitutales bacterium]